MIGAFSGHLFAGIANFDALHAAAKRAVLGKRKKPGASAFTVMPRVANSRATDFVKPIKPALLAA